MLFLNQLDTAKLILLFIDYLNSVTWLIAIDTILLFFNFFQYNSYIRIFLLNDHDPCPIMSSLVRMFFSWNNLINLFFFHLHRKIRTSEFCNAWNNHPSNSICGHHTVDRMFLYIRKNASAEQEANKEIIDHVYKKLTLISFIICL